MKTSHLSRYEQQEYLLNQRTPEMLRHLAECSPCREEIAYLQQPLSAFRSIAVAYSAESLASRPQRALAPRQRSSATLRWALAAVVLLVLALLPFHLFTPKPAPTAVAMSDDALLEQVDEQLSVAVPSPMESLTHLVSSDSSNARKSGLVSPGMRSQPSAQSN
jgi:anti-sigma factor RsiW